MLVTEFDDRFFYQTVMEVVKSLLVCVPGSKIEITYVPYRESSCDQDPDKFDILVGDKSDWLAAPELMYKWSFDRQTMKHSDFLKQIVSSMTEVWDI